MTIHAGPWEGTTRRRIIDPLAWVERPIPERRWVVPDLIPHGNVTILSGDGGVGKSLISMQLLTSCATRKNWLGRPVMPCKALGIFCEDDEHELVRRQAKINAYHDIGFGDLEDLRWISGVGENNVLVEDGLPTDTYDWVLEQATDFGAQLIVIDSLHDAFSGNENDRSEARRFVSLLQAMAAAVDGAVVVNAHPSLSGISSGSGSSGSTAWSNSVRSRLYLTSEPNNKTRRILSSKKSNYGNLCDDIGLEWRDGVFIPSGDLGSPSQDYVDELVFLQCLDAAGLLNIEVSDAKQGKFAPKVFSQLAPAQNSRVSVNRLEVAMLRLLGRGEIVLENFGPPSRGKKRLKRA